MAFGKKLEKQDLIDAGLDPDKLSGLIGTAVTKDQLDALKTELATANKTQFDEIKNSLAELTTKLTTKSVGDNKGTGGNGGNGNTETPEEIREREMLEFTSDPTGYIARKTGGSSAFAAVEAKKIARDIAYDEAVRTMPGFKNTAIRLEMEEEWKKYTPQGMVQTNTDPRDLVKRVYNMVMGSHMEDFERDKDKTDGKYNLVHSGGGGGSNNTTSNRNNNNGGGTVKPEDQLTALEKEQATRFGMTAQEWLDSKKGVDTEVGLYSKMGQPVS